MMTTANITMTLAIIANLTAAINRAMEQDRDVTEEEMNDAWDRAREAHSSLQDAAEDQLNDEGNDNA